MNSRAFMKRIFKTGEGTTEEIIKYILKNYFLKGLTLDDFESDLLEKYKKNEWYAKALKDTFADRMKMYSR